MERQCNCKKERDEMRDRLRRALWLIANDQNFDATDSKSVLVAFDRHRATARDAFKAS